VSFVSRPFVILFMVVFAARVTLGRRKNEPAFVGVLVAAGAVFYGWHVWAYLLLLLTSTSVDYCAGLALGRLPRSRTALRRLVLAASLSTNLGLLACFKYGDLVLRTLGAVAGFVFDVPPLPTLGWVLPIGISFYTFEAMSYTIDVYRGDFPPLRRFTPFFLFISFFPHLVAGPIVRAKEFLPQVPRVRRLHWPVFFEGAWLITTGFFLKVVCADNLATSVDRYWRGSYGSTNSTFALWLALMFSGQIFADFAGYSNIARGLAYLLGYRLPLNFDAPYVAASFKNFWERWHITLSRWLRDYLYVPLGGNRRGALRTYGNLLLVMLLGGLWHGAAFHFVAWGGIHGVALAAERWLGIARWRKASRWRQARAALYAVTVQTTVLIAWVFFRSDSIPNAARFTANIFRFDFRPLPASAILATIFLVPIAVLHAWTWLIERQWVRPLSPFARAAMSGAMAYATLTLYSGRSDFIYFQF